MPSGNSTGNGSSPDLILINPLTSLNIENNEPLNLLSLASYLRHHGIESSIYDEIRPLYCLEEKAKKAKYIGITANACSYPRAVELLPKIKAINPDALLIAGGVHPTTAPEEALKHGFDIVVSGEGERALLHILQDNVKEGIITGEAITNEELYLPARDLVDMEFYSKTKKRSPHDPNLNFVKWGMNMACFLSSRGCPYSCTFCHNLWRKTKIRYVPEAWVIEEIDILKKKYGVSAVWFMDDHIFLNKKRSRKIFQEIIDNKFNIVWASACRADSLDEELLELAYRSGCRRLAIGIESGTDRILKKLAKGTTVEINYNAIALCRKYKIKTLSTIMIGNPTETEEEIKKSLEFILKSKTDYVAISILTPFPGTKIWKMCEEEGRLPKDIDFRQFNYLKAPVRITDHVSPRELEKMKRNMLIRFYLCPRNLFPMMGKWIRNPKSMFKKIIEYF